MTFHSFESADPVVDLLIETASRIGANASRLTSLKNCRLFAARQDFSVKGLDTTPLSDGKGPEAMKAKAEIVRFLKESFAFGHKAVATLTPANSVETVGKNKRTRLFLATFAAAHCFAASCERLKNSVYAIAFATACGPSYHSRPNGSTSELRSTREGKRS